MTDARDEDARIEELFAGALDTFVARRDQLARDLRAGGERDAATAVKQLRRPSRAAWALNQAARDAPALLDAVVDAGTTLLDRQQRALSDGPSPGLREAMRERQRALGALADVAVAALGANSESVRDAIERTLQAVSVDPEAATQLRAGRLAQDLEPPDVFGTLTPGPQAAVPRAPRERSRPGSRPTAPESQPEPEPSPEPLPARASTQRKEDAALRDAERAAALARDEVAHAQREFDDAQGRATELARVAKAAAADAKAAERAAMTAAGRIDKARERLEVAERSLRNARRVR